MATDYKQWKRKASLVLLPGPLEGNNPSAYTPGGNTGLDLSELHFRFSIAQQDVESPNNATIRVYNLNDDTIKKIRGEFSRVVVQAGYEPQFGVIFDGTVKQFRTGRERNVDSYLDILAGDGDLGYNFGFVNSAVAAGSTSAQRLSAIYKDLAPLGLTPGVQAAASGGTLPRGKVLFGMGPALLRNETTNIGATWSIQNGKIDIIPLTGYKRGEVVNVNSQTGLIGMPEATSEGIVFRTLLNPRLIPGNVVQIDNKSINQTIQAGKYPVAYNQYTGIQFLASVTDDGYYRLFVVEHSGDTRGQEWYSKIIALAADPTSLTVKAYG
jgi:hypothetical protein